MSRVNHYKWLEKHLPGFFLSLDMEDVWKQNQGLIGAHGDKAYSYQYDWEEAGIPFPHGVAIFLLTYLRPFASEVRVTSDGWVKTSEWVVENYERFRPHLPLVDTEDPDVMSQL